MNCNFNAKDLAFIKKQLSKSLTDNEKKLQVLQNKLKAYEFKAYFYKKLLKFINSSEEAKDQLNENTYVNSALIESVFEKAKGKFSDLQSDYVSDTDGTVEDVNITKNLPDISSIEKLISEKTGKSMDKFQAVPLQIVSFEEYDNEPDESKSNFTSFVDYYTRINKYVDRYQSDLTEAKNLNFEQLQLNAIIKSINI